MAVALASRRHKHSIRLLAVQRSNEMTHDHISLISRDFYLVRLDAARTTTTIKNNKSQSCKTLLIPFQSSIERQNIGCIFSDIIIITNIYITIIVGIYFGAAK